MANIPFFNRSTQDYSTPDVYSQNQQLTEAKDDYETHQKDLQPKPYRESMKPIFSLCQFWKTVFPPVSGLTLFSLVVFLSVDVNLLLSGELSLTQWVVGIVSFLMGCFAIFLNETGKTLSLDKYFRATSTNEKPDKWIKRLAGFTILLSTLGSCAGLFLITYQMTNKTPEYKGEHESRLSGIEQEYTSAKNRINAEYKILIDAKQATIDSYHPTRYRTKRDNLTAEKTALINERDSKLDKLKEGKNSDSEKSENTFISQSTDTQGDAWTMAGIALFMVLLGELLNGFSHRFIWTYKVKCQNEGIEFGALESLKEMNSYAIQLQRMSQHVEKSGVLKIAAIQEQVETEPMEKIGFRKSGKPVESSAQMNLIKRELETLKEMLRNGNLTPVSVAKSQPKMETLKPNFSTENQPKRKAKNFGNRIERTENIQAIKAAYRALESSDEKPTQAKISEVTGLSRTTVGKIIRELKKDKAL